MRVYAVIKVHVHVRWLRTAHHAGTLFPCAEQQYILLVH